MSDEEKKFVCFHHGGLADKYEKQAREQGYTFGKEARWIQKMGDGILMAYVHGCMTDGEHSKILKRFQSKILMKHLKPIEEASE